MNNESIFTDVLLCPWLDTIGFYISKCPSGGLQTNFVAVTMLQPGVQISGIQLQIRAEASSVTADRLTAVFRLATKLEIDLLVGFMERDGEKFYLTQGVFRPDGTTDFYRKPHLGSRKQNSFTPGDELGVHPLSCGVKVGFQLCVDTPMLLAADVGLDSIPTAHYFPVKRRKELYDTNS